MKLYFEEFDYSTDKDLERFDEAVSLLVSVFKKLNRKGLDLEDIESACEKAMSEFDLDEAVVKGREVDLTTKEKTIAFALNDPENKAKATKILEDAEANIIPFMEAKQQMLDLFNSFENVNEQQKRNAEVALRNAKNPHHLTSIVTTYMLGEKVGNKLNNIYR